MCYWGICRKILTMNSISLIYVGLFVLTISPQVNLAIATFQGIAVHFS